MLRLILAVLLLSILCAGCTPVKYGEEYVVVCTDDYGDGYVGSGNTAGLVLVGYQGWPNDMYVFRDHEGSLVRAHSSSCGIMLNHDKRSSNDGDDDN